MNSQVLQNSIWSFSYEGVSLSFFLMGFIHGSWFISSEDLSEKKEQYAFSCLFVRSFERTPVISICLLQHHFVISCGRFPPPMAPLFYSLKQLTHLHLCILISKIFLILQIFEICSNGLCNALCNFEKFTWGQLVKILLLYPSTLWPFLCHWSS